MTTVPGHNQILPQSVLVQELNQQAHAAKPSADQAAAIQQAQQALQGSSVQETQGTERLKKKQEKNRQARRAATNRQFKKEEEALDPDAPGQLLDTRA